MKIDKQEVNSFYEYFFRQKILLGFTVFYTILVEIVAAFNLGPLSIAGLLAVIVVVALVKTEYGVSLLLVLMLVSDDLPRRIGLGIHNISSVYTIPSVNMIITISISIVLIYVLVITRRTKYDAIFLSVMKGVMLIGIISFVIGIRHLYDSPRVVLHDLSYFINYIVFAVLTYTVFDKKNKLNSLLVCIVGAMSIKYLYLALLFVIGYGEMAGSLVQVVSDTGKKIVPVFAVLYFVIIYQRKELRLSTVGLVLSSVLFAAAAMLSYSIASRSTMLFFLIMLLLAVWKQEGGIWRPVRGLLGLTASMVFMIVIINILQPDSLNYLLWKIRSTSEISLSTQQFTSYSPIARYVSFLNIMYMHFDHGTILLGAGAGSYFTDEYVQFPFSLYGKTAFAEEWILSGKFYKPHTTPIFMFLKIGVLGSLLYYWLFYKIYRYARTAMRHIESVSHRVYLNVFSVSLLVFSINNFSSKMQISGGIVVGIIFAIISIYARTDTRSHGSVVNSTRMSKVGIPSDRI